MKEKKEVKKEIFDKITLEKEDTDGQWIFAIILWFIVGLVIFAIIKWAWRIVFGG